jgi:DNA-binding beta-propeller fold protein YncE
MGDHGPRRRQGGHPIHKSLVVVALVVLVTACGASANSRTADPPATISLALPGPPAPLDTEAATPDPTSASTEPAATTSTTTTVPGVYAHTGVGMLSPAVADAKSYVYVPSNDDGSVTVIDQSTMQIVNHYKVGKLVQHVVASWDLKTLYATASASNHLVEIDPKTGDKGRSIPVAAPYNLYFTPDGSTAIVMAERLNRMDFYDPVSWKKKFSVAVPCKGVNHADWSVDGTFFLATCEFSGDVLKVDTATGAVLNKLPLEKGSMPQDLRLAPTGDKFFVADMDHGCVWIIDAMGTTVIGSIETGIGPHGIYPSRDATRVYVTNRGRTSHDGSRKSRPGEGSVSVIDPKTDAVVATWTIPEGGSPDMGGVSADGKRLWLSGRYDDVVYVFDTVSGALLTTIPVPGGPHGLAVFPQPGRFSLGHTGNYR